MAEKNITPLGDWRMLPHEECHPHAGEMHELVRPDGLCIGLVYRLDDADRYYNRHKFYWLYGGGFVGHVWVDNFETNLLNAKKMSEARVANMKSAYSSFYKMDGNIKISIHDERFVRYAERRLSWFFRMQGKSARTSTALEKQRHHSRFHERGEVLAYFYAKEERFVADKIIEILYSGKLPSAGGKKEMDKIVGLTDNAAHADKFPFSNEAYLIACDWSYKLEKTVEGIGATKFMEVEWIDGWYQRGGMNEKGWYHDMMRLWQKARCLEAAIGAQTSDPKKAAQWK